ncbi:MAG: lysophospholipid acyltransferase family protein, partial [bacterium]|nr:lysophospholipid acyltransferase family protein [bacterium]
KKNKGVLFCTIHLGNWHLMDYALALHGLPLVHILKEQRNKKVFEHLTSRIKISGKDFVILHRTPKNIISALSQGKIVEFLCDQDAGKSGMFVDFFGEKASTALGPALFHKKLTIPIILAYDVYENGLHHAYLEPYEHYEKTVEEIIHDYTAYFEDVIRRYPEQYLWLHKRWNTRPPE